MTRNAFSTKVVFEDREFVGSHMRKPRFSADAGGWAFKVYDWDGGKEVIWTRGRSVREIKAEIAAKVQAPVGATIVAFVQP